MSIVTVVFEESEVNILSTISSINEIGWHLDRINIEDAWEITQGNSEVVVAVLDSGINFTHPELAHTQWINTDEIPNNLIDDDNNGYIDDVHGWDYVFDDNNPEPSNPNVRLNFHGTFIAGVIAGKKDNLGIVGVAPNIKIMNLRVWYDPSTDEDDLLWATRDDIGEAVNYAVANGADVISCSFSAKKKLTERLSSVAYYNEMEAAVKAGVVIVASAGNDASDSKRYPACFDFVIGVGATDYYDNLASYSSYGKDWVDLVAPGGDNDGADTYQINSTNIDGGYTTAYGTSYSTPIVAGVVALMRSVEKTLSPELIRRILRETAIDLGATGKDNEFSYGLVNAYDAVVISQTASTSQFIPGFTIIVTISAIMVLPKKPQKAKTLPLKNK
ncbi:MAG: S8 family serine peptidase [Candidatus Thorarchaeota archaeon]